MKHSESFKKIIDLRKKLHQKPEISGHEAGTSAMIKAFLEDLAPDEMIENLGPYGLAAVFNGTQDGPTTLIRAELDALPIPEEGNVAHKSLNAGVSHTCGHDGHMAIVCGVAAHLSETRPKKGRVVLIFQPSEETGLGAAQVIESKNYRKIQPDYVFALHNLPGYEKNEIVLKKGAFTAASKGMTIQLKGRTSHAAHPEDGRSPAEAMCKLIVGLEKLPEIIAGFSLVTVIHAQLGEVAFGTTPGNARVMATLRTYENDIMSKLTQHAERLAELVAKESGLDFSISYCEEFEAVVNDPAPWELVNESAKELKLKTKHIRNPFRWSEDFGKFSTLTDSLLFGIGSGKKQPQLHEGHYDFPDEIIPSGVAIFVRVIEKLNH
ncbi:amidohydrolase [Cyclobacterium lianum]|uniref:Amidohydrolase n=1 Tax=Cyclobacterium lianum TaxID=388280 RepID=A0A1M7K493_9BACT|nr:amidohydrolase [Cyclobacterium lianum]SHM60109.1 amidohydrolase [Cyclobacterium lianum]